MLYKVKSVEQLRRLDYLINTPFISALNPYKGSFPSIYCGKIFKFKGIDKNCISFNIVLEVGIKDWYRFAEHQVDKIDTKLAKLLYE